MEDIRYTTEKDIEALKEEIASEKHKNSYKRAKKLEQKQKVMNTALVSDNEINFKNKVSKDKKSHNKLKLAGNILFIFLVIVLVTILVSILVAKSTGQTPKLFGYQVYIVQTGSMEPTLPVGTYILVKEVEDTSDLKEGDIITFVRKGSIVTHRIIEVINNNGEVSYRMKGDNPINSPDQDLVLPKDIKGIYTRNVFVPSFS